MTTTMTKTMTTADRFHEQALAASPREMAGLLEEVLTRELAAFTIGVDDPDLVRRWASGEETAMTDRPVEARLRAAYEIVLLLLGHDAPRTIRGWFFGRKTDLGEASPAEAIRDDRFEEASLVAHAFLAHG